MARERRSRPMHMAGHPKGMEGNPGRSRNNEPIIMVDGAEAIGVTRVGMAEAMTS